MTYTNKNFLMRGALLFSLLVVSLFTNAQESTFTQYSQSPLIINPSFVANQNILSATVHHRSQELTKSVNLNSSMLSVVAPLLSKDRERRWGGWGLSVLHNTLKSDMLYRMVGVSGTYAYNLPLYEKHYLSFGMQAGFYQRKVDIAGFTTGSQWNNSTGFDPSAPTGESSDIDASNYFSGAVGFTYYIESDMGRKLFYLGGSAFNINKPDISLTNIETPAEVRYSGQVGVVLLRNHKFHLGPEVFYNRDNSQNIYHAGARGSYFFQDNNPLDVLKDGRIDVKLGYRVNNAITFETQIYQPNFSFGFSYDVAVSQSQQAGVYNNAFEFTLSLRKLFSGKRKRKQTSSPIEYSNLGEVRQFYFNKKSVEKATGSEKEVKSTGDTVQDNRLKQFGEGEFKFKLKKDFKFGLNDAELNADAKAYLDEMSEILKSNPTTRLEVIGHTDNTGNDNVNKRVSTMRALSVIDYLIEQGGVDRSRLTMTAMGAKEPLVGNDSEESRAMNRRVEFVIYQKE